MNRIQVNQETVSPNIVEQERQQLLEQLGMQGSQIPNDRVRLMIDDRVRQNVIDHYLLKQEAARRGLEVDGSEVDRRLSEIANRYGGRDSFGENLAQIGESLETFRGQIRDRMLVDLLVDRVHEDVKDPRDKDLKRYFKEHRADFSAPEQVEVEQIVKQYRTPADRRRAKEEIEKTAEAIQNGKSFVLMVRQRSDRPAKEGKLGWISRGDLDASLETTLFSLGEGEVSDPVEWRQGWYLFRITGKRAASGRSFDEVREEIRDTLANERKQEALESLLDKLRKGADIAEG